jgi:hypothetical protein
MVRDKSGAVIIQHSEHELKENAGYRLIQLENRVNELENKVKELADLLYIYRGENDANHKPK